MKIKPKMDKNSNHELPLKRMLVLLEQVENEQIMTYEKTKTYLDTLHTISKMQGGILGETLNQGANVLKTLLTKSEDFSVLQACIHYMEDKNFIYNTLIEKYISNTLTSCIENPTNMWRLFDIWPQNKINKFIILLNKKLKEHKPETEETIKKHIFDLFLNSDNRNVVIMAFRLMISLDMKLPVESNPEKIVRFVVFINNMRMEKNPDWSTNLCHLIENCDTNIHQRKDILKPILEILETAFRNTFDINERLYGFDCWKALIDNYSLDMEFFTNKRQLKLLLTPLKAKLSKQDEVIVKRFNLFIHLLETLKENAIKCLDDFLEFVFGCVGENKDPTKCGLAKTVKKLWQPIIDVFEAILSNDNFNFKLKQIVNRDNIIFTHKIVVNSMFEACNIINEEEFKFDKKETLIKHLWKLLFNTIFSQNNTENINICLEYVFETTSNNNCDLWYCFWEIFCENQFNNFNYFFKILPKVFQEEKSVNLMDKTLNYLKENMKNNKDNLFEALKYFLTLNDDYKMKFLCNFWMNIALCLIEEHNLTDEDIFEFVKYPILHFNQQYDRKIIQNVCKLWTILYLTLNDANKQLILEELIRIQDKFVLKCFIKEVAFSKHREFNSIHASIILDVIENLLKHDSNHENINIFQYFLSNDYENVHNYFKNGENIDKLSNCIKYSIEIGKKFNTLNGLFVTLTQMEKNDVKIEQFTENFQFLYDLYKNDKNLTETNKELIENVLKLLKIDTNGEKIVKNDLKVQILSPTKIQINSTRGQKMIENVRNVPVDEESASKFVLIDTEVQFDKNNLNEHQKEVMERRRDDIPALYEDLTQSQTGFDVENNKNQPKKTKRELKRLQMDIVGAMEYKNSTRKRNIKQKINSNSLSEENQVENEEKPQPRRKSMDFGLLAKSSEYVGRRRRPKNSLDIVPQTFSEDIIENTQEIVEKTPINEEIADNTLRNDAEVEDLLKNPPDTPITNCNLPSSPITGDTPTRNDELLNNTLNISPIQTENVPEKQNIESPKKEKVKPNKGLNERSSRLLSLVNVNFKRLQPLPVSMSPSFGNLRLKKTFNGQSTKTKDEFEQDDVLTFSRDVPSPLEVPKKCILKRKHAEIADDLHSSSPNAKRKRVNFSDPILTSKKLIIKDDNEFNKEMTFDELFVEEEDTEVIYPDLVNCDENVTNLLKNIEANVEKALEDKNITTVGDLASLTKSQLAKIPFKDSINVVSLLEKYHLAQLNEQENDEEKIFNKIKTTIESDLKNLPIENRMKLYSNLLELLTNDLPTEETFNLHLNCLKTIHHKVVNKE